jgi:hypothetical protein
VTASETASETAASASAVAPADWAKALTALRASATDAATAGHSHDRGPGPADSAYPSAGTISTRRHPRERAPIRAGSGELRRRASREALQSARSGGKHNALARAPVPLGPGGEER